MPRRQDDKKKEKGTWTKEPVITSDGAGSEIEQATLVAPALDLFYPVIIRGRHPQPDKAESIGGELATSKSVSVTAAGLGDKVELWSSRKVIRANSESRSLTGAEALHLDEKDRRPPRRATAICKERQSFCAARRSWERTCGICS